MSTAFLDSNVLAYAFDEDHRSNVARNLLAKGGVVSVQCLNELANVLSRKRHWTPQQVSIATTAVTHRCPIVVAVDLQLHRHGLRLAERYRLSIYDAMIVQAALTAECGVLYSEDMHAGLIVEGRLTIVNPFA